MTNPPDDKTERRDFLKTAGAAFTTSLFTGNIRGANDRLAGAFIGVGVMGSENLDVAARQPGVAIASVCDVFQPNLERAAAIARRRGHQPKEVKDFREIISDSSVDFVCISTPDHWHPYMTVEACKAGKDVYVEKPVCLTINEGRTMAEAARKYNRVVQAGTWQRSGAHFQKACEIVRGGQLGKIAFCRAWIYENAPAQGIGNPPGGSPPPDLDWDLWLGPAPEHEFNPNRFGVYPKQYSYFRWFWDYAGGQLTDSGVHVLDILQMAFGETMPKAITALGGKLWFTDDRETPDTLLVSYEYPGFIGAWEHRCNNTEANPRRLMGLTFHGTNGTLYVDRSLYRITPEAGSGLDAAEMKRVADPHPLHWVNFLDCVRTRARPNSDIETCFRSSATCLLGNASYRSGLRVDFDEQTMAARQPEAARYLHREYRAPWKLEA
ncbi:MAG: Gfo/Idh/MocA family oxidoreductase [Bryobacteraceae bacterium]|nr:Gfo/Idh/MocA family oxidoreductase [Bryobacteraceae bacterium]